MPDELSDLLNDLDEAEKLTKDQRPKKALDARTDIPEAEPLPRDDGEETIPEAEPMEPFPPIPSKDPVINGLMDDLRNIIESMGECRSILKGTANS